MLALTALRERGIKDPERNVVVILGRDVFGELFGTVLARLRPWTPVNSPASTSSPGSAALGVVPYGRGRWSAGAVRDERPVEEKTRDHEEDGDPDVQVRDDASRHRRRDGVTEHRRVEYNDAPVRNRPGTIDRREARMLRRRRDDIGYGRWLRHGCGRTKRNA